MLTSSLLRVARVHVVDAMLIVAWCAHRGSFPTLLYQPLYVDQYHLCLPSNLFLLGGDCVLNIQALSSSDIFEELFGQGLKF